MRRACRIASIPILAFLAVLQAPCEPVAGAEVSYLFEVIDPAAHLALAGQGEVKVSYELPMDQWKDTPGHGPHGFLCGGYMLTAVPWALLVPDSVPVARFLVRFRLPADWRAVAPWRGTDAGFEETDIGLFRDATFAAGRFEECEETWTELPCA